MGGQNNILIPARFLVTIGHLIAMIMVKASRKRNVYASLGIVESDADYDPYNPSYDVSESAANDQLEIALNVSYACFALDLLGMVGGFTLFFSKINLFQIVVHFIGGVYISWFVAYGWQWESIWYIVGFTNITTALVEVMMLIAIFVIKIVVY
ncbi:hypothetical protein TrCOL_g11146 [Triparma columacea]|uniref:Transmembrane protein 107 n=1 Tax=Triparma columacea TaxID=722753 RepID=A0A9W7GMD2_9STRA|nr:hypothetical protein TrCOL_g11146 [Triparma columacea]